MKCRSFTTILFVLSVSLFSGCQSIQHHFYQRPELSYGTIVGHRYTLGDLGSFCMPYLAEAEYNYMSIVSFVEDASFYLAMGPAAHEQSVFRVDYQLLSQEEDSDDIEHKFLSQLQEDNRGDLAHSVVNQSRQVEGLGTVVEDHFIQWLQENDPQNKGVKRRSLAHKMYRFQKDNILVHLWVEQWVAHNQKLVLSPEEWLLSFNLNPYRGEAVCEGRYDW